MNTTGSIADELDPEYRMDGSCWKFEPVYSDGIWYQMLQNKENILKHSSVRLNIQISIIFFLTSFIHFFLRRIHLPRIVAEILAGMILGPSLIGKYFPGLSTIFFPPDSMKILSTLMRFGYLFFMFLIGVKMDAGLLRKSGSKSWVIGTINTLVPMLTMVTIAKDISRTSDKYPEPAVEWVSVFSGTLMITSFPAVALLLTHLKIINSELGHLALSSALVSDTTSVVLINLESYLKLIFGVSPRVGFKSIFLSMLLIIVIVTFLRSTMYWIIRRTPEGKPVRSNYVFLVVILVMLVGIIGDNVGLQFLYGPFIFGLIVPTGPPLASVLVERLDTIVTGLLLPLISTLCGFRSNLWELQHSPPMFLTFMLSCGFTVKLLSTFIPASCCRVPRRDAALLSLICSAQSIVQLGVFITNFNKQPLASGQFTIAVLTVFVLATAIPVIISSVYDPSEKYLGYQKRTIVHSTEAEGLRILVSAHRQDDALAAAKLLDITAPTKESPLFVIGLYLESLVGGSTPLILDHQLGQKLSTFGGSRWQPVIDVFTLFKSKHDKSAQVKVFTAISPSKLMHEHISWVAFDHSVSLIILPFHKKWNAKGNVVMENNAARLLNSNVMDKAPCSVAIYIDRSKIRIKPYVASSVYRVAILSMAGKDDLEALAFARWITRCPTVHLTIIKFVAVNSYGHNVWENILHQEYTKDMLRHCKHDNISCEERVVRDGAETSLFIKSVASEYNLVLVGRRHETHSPVTFGLSEFCELPELGLVGDMLASADICNTCSVLILQQQVIRNV